MIVPLFTKGWYKQHKEKIISDIDDDVLDTTELLHMEDSLSTWVNNLPTQADKDKYTETVKEVQHSLDHLNAAIQNIPTDTATKNSQKERSKRALVNAATQLPSVEGRLDNL